MEIQKESTLAKSEQVLIGLAVVHAVLGVLGVEYSLRKSSRFRDGNEERDSKFPAFRRRDAKKWHRAKLYPMAILTMPVRIFLVLFFLIWHVFLGL